MSQTEPTYEERESEERFRTVADFTYDWEYWLGPDGNYIYVSPSCERITGYRADEFMRDPNLLAAIVHPDDRDALTHHSSERSEGGAPMMLDFRIITRSGQARWINHVCQMVYGADGRWLGRRGSNRDITERKQAEARVLHLNEVLRAVRNVNQLIMWQRDPQRLLSEACAILVQTRGYRMAWIGRIEAGDVRVIPAARAGLGTEYLDEVTITWDERATGQGPAGMAIRTRRAVGCADIATDPRLALWRATALRHGFASVATAPMLHGERLFGVVSVYADQSNAFDDEEISLLAELAGDLGFALQSIENEAERKRAEEALRESEERYRSVAESARDAIITADHNDNIVDWNGGARQMFGYDVAEMIGQPLRRLMPVRYRAVHEANMVRLAAGGTPRIIGKTMEMYGLRKDGSELPLELSLAMWKTAQGMFYTAIMRDITERKTEAERQDRLMAELVRSNAELERFAYIASHDLQEPLRMVTSFVQLLGERYRGQLDADADEFIGYAVEGAQRMSRLILDLLEFSRVGTRGQPLEPTDCAEVLAQVERELGEEIAAAQAVITHDPLPTITADRAQLVQLFAHLIFNALKFRCADPPRVHVSARAMDDGRSAYIEHRPSNIAHRPSGWIFSVRDNGIGIDPQYHEEIFRAFRRLHTRRVYQGNGIGLAICKKIVERHGGRMWVESQVGQGSTFYFTLPAAAQKM